MKLVANSLLAIAVIHSLFAVVRFWEPLTGIVADGVVGAAHGNPERSFAIWFIYTGFAWLLLGLTLRYFDGKGLSVPSFIGWGLLAFASLGALVSPKSGFWLLFIPAVAALRSERTTELDGK